MTEILAVTSFHPRLVGYLDFGYRVHALLNNFETYILSNVEKAKEELDIPEERFILLPFDRRKLSLFRNLLYFIRILWIIHKVQPRKVIFLTTFFGPFAWICARPYVLYWNEHPTHQFPVTDKHLSTARRLKNKALLRLCYFAARRADCVMPNGEHNYQDLLNHGVDRGKTQLLYLGVGDIFKSVRAEARHSEKECVNVVYTGSVKEERGRDVMLEALAIANKDKKRIHLTFVGAFRDQIEYCRKRAAELSIADAFTIVERVPGYAIPFYLQSADFGICIWKDTPYYQHNPPTKLFEYLASGLPVLASNIRTHTHYIRNWSNGVIFEYDVEGLAQAFKAIWEEKSKLPKMKESAALFGKRFFWSNLEPVFLEVCKPGN